MSLRLLVPPAAEPLLLTETKTYLRVTDGTDDALIAMLIAAARQAAEHELNRVLLTQTWELVLDRFPSGAIVLSRNPVQSVTEIRYRDGAGASQLLPASDYRLDAASLIARIDPTGTQGWPATHSDPGAVSIVFVAGYGENASDVPAAIRQWMLTQVAHWYDERAATTEAKLVPTPFLGGLLDPFRIPQC